MGQATAIDLFSGCGGLSLGLVQAGFRVLGAVEIDQTAADTYKSNLKGVVVKRVNISDLPANALMHELNLHRGALDLLAGCPPCQGFSNLRTRNGAANNRDPRNNLVREMLRFTRVFRPKAIMMENVPALQGRKPFRQLCDRLRALGYEVTWDVKDVARFGVPQRRRRLILLPDTDFKFRLRVSLRDCVRFVTR